MQEREEVIVSGLVTLMLVIWLGFEFHDSPRFAGSFQGGVLAVVGAGLMLVPGVYIAIKRVKWIRKATTKWISMRTILALHIYAGVIGPILVVLHTGHKFESTLGIVLTALTLIVVVSGFIGRYLLSRVSRSVRDSDKIVKQLRGYHEQAGQEILKAGPTTATALSDLAGMRVVLQRIFFRTADVTEATVSPIARVIELSETIAEIEYSRQMQTAVKRTFRSWLKLHIVLSCTLYLLMGLHVWAAIHFGLRWFE